MKALFLIFITILTAGCSSSYNITYDTDVDGAMLVCGGKNEGYTPKTLYYDVDKENRKRGSFRTVECEARWSSGARKTFSNNWDLNRFPDGVRQTLTRPNVGSYQQDADFALRVQARKAQQEQANKVKVRQAWAKLNTDLKNLNRTLGSTPTVTPTPSSNYNLDVLPAPTGYESTYVPTGTVGVLTNASITNGYKLCEYNNGRAIRLPMNQQCPTVLNP
jgi:hypothetical protein